ncbi:uncharacterized protein LOC117512857 isoform X1 [Thalassophryne amazonica]|uniref:uncharacterized protein LOC117512857 isoform X1 n=1 Tax=Thalassophryne amazonica TaxID=390379 RepID=UPI001470F65B|nr:uncharacterized protein LOC117512857 isoform X1 [Thalassophryne amazonica]
MHTVGTNEGHTDKDTPPPLPERTPESYELAVDEECWQHRERLTVIHPPNTVTEHEGSPPPPVPPLPERTPESFELVINEAPVEQSLKVTPAVNLNKIGTSSEWFGSSKQTAAPSLFTRSKSLKTKSVEGGHRNFTQIQLQASALTTPQRNLKLLRCCRKKDHICFKHELGLRPPS